MIQQKSCPQYPESTTKRFDFVLSRYIHNGILRVRVTPHATQTKIVEENGSLKVYLKSIPEKDKANRELIKFFKQEFNLKVRIKSGAKSREKVLEVVG